MHVQTKWTIDNVCYCKAHACTHIWSIKSFQIWQSHLNMVSVSWQTASANGWNSVPALPFQYGPQGTRSPEPLLSDCRLSNPIELCPWVVLLAVAEQSKHLYLFRLVQSNDWMTGLIYMWMKTVCDKLEPSLPCVANQTANIRLYVCFVYAKVR